MKLHFKSAIILIFIVILSTPSIAQSLQHPTIYATAAERQKILDKIANNAWAQSMVNSLKSKVDSKIVTHNTDPGAIFSTVGFFLPMTLIQNLMLLLILRLTEKYYLQQPIRLCCIILQKM